MIKTIKFNMLIKNENLIYKIIRWAPIAFVIILSIIITYLTIVDHKIIFDKKIFELKEKFVKEKNNNVKAQVNSLIEYISYAKTISEDKLRQSLKQRVYEAHAIANNIYKNNINKDKQTILKLIKDALRKIRFNQKRAYYFIHDIEGNILLYPLERKEEGNNYKYLQDKNGYYFVQTIINVIKNKNENFDEYYWEKLRAEDNKNHKKITFSKYFEPLNIAISTGDYVVDYEKSIKEELLVYINSISSFDKSYFFIIDENAKLLVHSNKSFISKEHSSLPKDTAKMFLDILKLKRNSDVFITYINKNKDSLEFNNIEKTSYVKDFDEWNWKIGKGYYSTELNELIKIEKDKLNKEEKESLSSLLMLSILGTFVLLLISFYVSNLIRKRFLTYKKELVKEIFKNREKDSLLAQQSKMAAMGEMLANIAHQWKQPLSVISSASTGLKVKKEFDILSDEELYEDLDIINNSTIYLSKTIDDFSNFFKSKKALEKTSTKKIWKIIDNLISSQFKVNDIELILNIKELDLYILSNELIQVLLNLINNSKDQFINLHEKDKKRFIFVTMFKEEDNLIITVKDNAGGIDSAVLPRIFEPYFTTKHKSQGTGIGLYMCDQIVSKNLNGKISATSIEYTYKKVFYKGAILEVSIPLKN